MHQLESSIIDQPIVSPMGAEVDKAWLESVYRIVARAMNGRTKVAGMEPDDVVQLVLLTILKSERFGAEKLVHFGLIRAIARNLVLNGERRIYSRPKHETLAGAYPARRRPDPLLVSEFLERAYLYLNDSHLELLTLCLERGYRLDRSADRRAAARGMDISLKQLRHMLAKLRSKHGAFWREYLALF